MSVLSCLYSTTLKSFQTEVFELLIAIIIGCVIIYFIGSHLSHAWMVRRKKKVHVSKRSMSLWALLGGDLALQRLLDYNDARADLASIDASGTDLETELEMKHPDFKKLQSIVAKLEMCRKESIAVKKLEGELEKCRSNGKSHDAYEMEMLLVEALIYKGEFDKALKCQCLYDKSISDARRPFYKAILHILLDHSKSEAKTCCKEFKEIQRQFEWPRMLHEKIPPGPVSDFTKFENFVKLLKEDIRKAVRT